MTRYRIEIWQTDKPAKVMRKHRQYDCKWCAVRWAIQQAQGYQRGLRLPPDKVKWSVSRMTGHLTEWGVLYHSGQPVGGIAFKHGH